MWKEKRYWPWSFKKAQHFVEWKKHRMQTWSLCRWPLKTAFGWFFLVNQDRPIYIWTFCEMRVTSLMFWLLCLSNITLELGWVQAKPRLQLMVPKTNMFKEVVGLEFLDSWLLGTMQFSPPKDVLKRHPLPGQWLQKSRLKVEQMELHLEIGGMGANWGINSQWFKYSAIYGSVIWVLLLVGHFSESECRWRCQISPWVVSVEKRCACISTTPVAIGRNSVRTYYLCIYWSLNMYS